MENEHTKIRLPYGDVNSALAGKRLSPFDSLTTSIHALRDAQSRVSQLADKLAGATPPRTADGRELAPIGSGLIDAVEYQAEEMRLLVKSIFADLSRIEDRL